MKKLSSKIPYILASVFFVLAIHFLVTYDPKPPKPLPVIKKEVNIGKHVAPHVVPYRAEKYMFRRLATGFYISYFGRNYILTNRHVCESSGSISPNHSIFGNYLATIVAKDSKHDLCLLTSNRDTGLILAEEQPKGFDPVFLVGYPRGIGKVIRKGHIIEAYDIVAHWLPIENKTVPTYMLSTTTYGGNSGSPVVNKYGEVVGVLFAGSPRYPTEGLMVPLHDVKQFLLEAVFGLKR